VGAAAVRQAGGELQPPLIAYSVRPGTAADLDAVTDIKVANWADTYAPLIPPAVLVPFLDRDLQRGKLKKEIEPPATSLLVAEDPSGRVIAFALTYLDREPEPWLESLHVLAEFRGRGAGTLLMRELAALLVARGDRSLRLGVITGNDAAARYYEALGATMLVEEPVTWAEGVRHQVFRWDDLTPLLRPKTSTGG
jgi:ribosomal protein S18 acetylase RimI-like enzyme